MLIPDYISPFTAYRTWHWEPDGTVRSLNGTEWTPSVAHVAYCRKKEYNKSGQFVFDANPHTAPEHDCRCGIYAAKNWKHLIEIEYAGYGIHGEVELWGKIEECRLGYRAQYAYPKFFVIPPNMLTNDMRETESKMEALIAFNVDMFVATDNAAKPDIPKDPLWVKDYGYSAQGIDFLVRRIQQGYSFHGDRPDENPEVGERLCVLNKGIGIVKQVTDKEVYITFYTQAQYRIPRDRVAWNRQNNRWETDTLGFMRMTRNSWAASA